MGLLGELMTFTEGIACPAPWSRIITGILPRPSPNRDPGTAARTQYRTGAACADLPLFFSEGTWIATISDPTLCSPASWYWQCAPGCPTTRYKPVHPAVKSGRYRQNPQRGQLQVPGIPLHTLTAAPRQLPWMKVMFTSNWKKAPQPGRT